MRMEEWADLGHLSYSPAPQLWTGTPLCFRVLFGKVQQCCISCNKTTGDFKFHHLQTGVSHLCPPYLFLQQNMKKVVFLCVFFKGTLGLFGGGGGGGGHVPLRPCPLGPALAIEKFYFYIFTWMPYAWPL